MKSIVTSIAASSLLDAKKRKNSSWAGVSAILLLLLSLPRPAAAQGGSFSPTGNANSLPGSVQAAQATSETQARLVKAYGRIPLSFEANQGQTDAQVRFVSRSRDYTLFLTGRAEALLVLRKRPPQATPADPLQSGFGKEKKPDSTMVRMNLVGANARPRVEGLGELPGKANYFIGADPKKWRTNVPTYAKVNYRAVYRGVDLVYYGNQSQLEHDFVVGPGVDPSVIRMGIEGPVKLSVNAHGDLVLMMKDGQIRFQKPMIYQDLDGVRHEVAGGYKLHDNHQVGFEIAAYDRTKPLVIDPQLVYSTYLGGSTNDGGSGIAVDSSGNAYVTGSTSSANFPTTMGAFQTAYAGGGDAFVTKLNSAGSALVYSTYLGGGLISHVGGGTDFGLAIAVDSTSNAYVTGSTDSFNFPTTSGAFQTFKPGRGNGIPYNNAFVTKLNSAGNGLVYSTYLGGSTYYSLNVNIVRDTGSGIAVDSSGNAYVTGSAGSTNFPTTPGAFQTVNAGGATGGADVFVTKVNPFGTGLVYSTYLGVGGGSGIAVDSSGSAYVTGSAGRTNFPTTTSAFQTAFAGGGDAFVTKVNPFGTGLVYSTYLGGGSQDYGIGVTVDSSGNAYVTGVTNSINFPTTPGAFQTAYAGGGDAFVTKVNPFGTGLVYSTYLGGSSQDSGNGVAVDSSGNAYVSGGTYSTNFPTTPAAFQTAYAGNEDVFVTKLNSAGNSLVYSTYLGGSGQESGNGVAVDSSGYAYVTGYTYFANFPTTPGAFQTANASRFNANAFVAKIADVASVSPRSLSFGNQLVGTTSAAQAVTLSNTGTAALGITNVSASGNFAADGSACGSSLAVSSSCAIQVTFQPQSSGALTGQLTIQVTVQDNSFTVITQTVSLTGNGTDFSISATPASRTIPIGQAAAFTLAVTPAGGFTGVVSLGCTGGPAAATCAIVPTSLTLDGSSSQTANVTIKFATNSDTKGTFSFTLTARSGGASRSTQVSVTVKE